MVHQAIRLGVRKFNVNTEVREAYVGALRQELQQSPSPDLVGLMQHAEAAMQAVVTDKLYLFGCIDKA
jgi:tagatose 1,6-diphosphate aldolase GatY/KbaY